MTTLFKSFSEKDKTAAVERLICDSSPRDDFFLMTVLSVFVAVFGLIANSASVIIGSMLIAPLMSPILGVAMGVVMADQKLISRSAVTVGKSILFSVPSAAIVAAFFGPLAGLDGNMNTEIAARLRPDVISACVAFAAGIAASYALVRPQLSATLPGVAVSVSLIPPLAVTGIGIAHLKWSVIANSFVLFLVNAALIIFAATVVFSLVRLYAKKPVADRAMQKEDAQIKKDKEVAKSAE
ncbi:MAG: TIGR00341 family protein [Patescibacteria group bacterium]|nr:TIGR00341 family protein [Patescibacteria group bacterium]